MWDYETDGKKMYPRKQQYLSPEQSFELLDRNPEEAVLRGHWGNEDFLREVSKLNPELQKTQFADYHGHGWIFRAVFKKDRKGNLLDAENAIIPWQAGHKFHGVVPLQGEEPFCDDACRQSQKAQVVSSRAFFLFAPASNAYSALEGMILGRIPRAGRDVPGTRLSDGMHADTSLQPSRSVSRKGPGNRT